LGKGFLTGKIGEDNPVRQDRLPQHRSSLYAREPESKSSGWFDLIGKFAQQKKATPAQIALAWLLAQKSHGSFRSLVQPSCIDSKRTSELLPSNLRPKISGSWKAQPQRSRCKVLVTPKNYRNSRPMSNKTGTK